MEKEYDFSKAIKNPFAGKFKGKYTVIVEHEDYTETLEVEMPKVKKVAESTINKVEKNNW